MRLTLPAFVLFLLGASAVSRGAIVGDQDRRKSIELAAARADVIIAGEVTGVAESFEGSLIRFHLTVTVSERIKGDPPERVEFTVLPPAWGVDEFRKGIRGPFMLHYMNGPSRPGARSLHMLDGTDALLSTRVWVSAEDGFAPVYDGQRLLALLRAWAQRPVQRSVELLVPTDSESAVAGVMFPATDEFHRLALAWAGDRDWRLRCNAARIFGQLTLREGEGPLRKLLVDPHYHESGAGKWYERHYPVREEAKVALELLGVARPRAVVTEPDDNYQAVNRAHVMIGCVALAGGFLAVRQARWHLLRTRTGIVEGLLLDLWALLLLLCVLGWVRGKSRADQFVWTTGSTRHELILYDGSAQWLTVPDWNRALPLQYQSFKPGTKLDEAWDVAHYTVLGSIRTIGIERSNGLVFGSTSLVTKMCSWSSVAVPHLAILLASLVLPMSAAAIIAVRRYLTSARQRCVHCGYDLRATAERCPECGTEIFGLKTRRQIAAMEAAQAQYQRELQAYHQHEARMLELLAAGAVDEEGRPVARADVGPHRQES